MRECRYTVCRPVWQEYQVPVRWSTCRPVYEQHVCCVPTLCYRTVTEPRQQVCKTYTCEPVWTEHCYKVCTGDWKTESHYCPGPTVTKCCRTPGTWCFDPCTCTSRYCPGEVVKYAVQQPGHCECRRVWCPKQETRVVRCCHYVPKEECHTVCYNVCKT